MGDGGDGGSKGRKKAGRKRGARAIAARFQRRRFAALTFAFEKGRKKKQHSAVKAEERRSTLAGRKGGRRGAGNSIWSDEASHVTLNLDLTFPAGSGDGGGGGGGESGVLGAAVRARGGGKASLGALRYPERKAIRSNPAEREQVTPLARALLGAVLSLSVIGEGRPR